MLYEIVYINCLFSRMDAGSTSDRIVGGEVLVLEAPDLVATERLLLAGHAECPQ
jgi:hypothetical protein